MTLSHPILKSALLSGAALAALGLAALPAGETRAEDCLLDANDDGQVTVNSSSSGGFVELHRSARTIAPRIGTA